MSTSPIVNKPADFEQYWKATLDELEQIPMAPEVDEIPLRSTDFSTTYAVRLTSIGPYRIFGYLSVPNGIGPFPVRYYVPRYGSVMEVVPSGLPLELRRNHITLSLSARGQRLSDQPFAASFPGLLTHGIDEPKSYIFRGIVADCCRGLEYLLSRPEVDHSHVAVIGGDLSLITAALCHQITHIVATPALFYAPIDLLPQVRGYPLEELSDYLHLSPSKREAVAISLSYFDLRWFAGQIKAPTFLTVGADGELLDRQALSPLLESLGHNVELYKTEHSGYKDGLAVEKWLASQTGLEPVLPEAWQ